MRMNRFFPLLMSLTVFLYVMGQCNITWGEDAPCPDADVYQRTEQFHGDSCVGQLIGIRLALAAKEALQKIGVSGKMKAKFFDRNCAVDVIQVAAGTTIGNKSLEIIDKNENRLELSDKTGKLTVEAKLTKLALGKSKVSLELKKKLKSLSADSNQFKQLKMEQEAISVWFRNATDSEVVTVRQMN